MPYSHDIVCRPIWVFSNRKLMPRCDSGSRHQSKFWSDEYLNAHNIPIRPELINDLLHT